MERKKNAHSKSRNYGYLLQDLGITGFLLCIFIGALLVAYAPESEQLEHALMFLALIVPTCFAAFHFSAIAIVIAGFQVLIYTIYKVYMAFAYALSIQWMSYFWLFLPILTVGSMILFIHLNRGLEVANNVLKSQVDDLVMIEPLTGLYNLRSMYNDLERQIAYVIRNNLSLTLMIIELRYEQELRQILSKNNFDMLRQRLAEIVEDSLRIEDRLYAIDEKGSVGIILTCDSKGAMVVQNRIKNNVSNRESFANITDKPIKVEIKIGFLEYNEENIKNAIQFRQAVESELQYDV